MSEENIQPQETVEDAPQKKIYVCRNYPKLKTRLGKRRVQFDHGRLELSDPEEIAIMDRAMQENTFLRAHVRVVDYAKGEEIARKHQEMLAAKRGTFSGPTTGEAIRKARKPMERDEALRRSGVDPESIQAFLADDGTMEMSLEDQAIAAAAAADRAAPAEKQETADDVAKTAADFDAALAPSTDKKPNPFLKGK